MNIFSSDTRLRILQVVNVRWFNATAWYGLFLSSLLQKEGHDVRVLCLPDTEAFAKAEAMGLGPEGLDLNTPLATLSLCRRMHALTREFKPHIVNCHRGESFILWGLLKKAMGFGLVRTRGDQRLPRGNFPNILLHSRVADAVIATSSGIATGMRTVLRVPADHVHTIYGGVDTRRFYPNASGREEIRTQLRLAPDDVAVGLVGRFDAVKGQKELIVSFARLCGQMGENARRMRLVLAGFATSSLSDEVVRCWAREAGIEDRVVFTGRCDDVNALMNALDLGVVASLGSETIARVALEIMACGVPLIGTRVGVMPDLLQAHALIAPGDEAAMTAMLHRFATESSFGESLRTEQRERMKTLREKDFLEQTLSVYRSVLSARQRVSQDK